MFKPIEIKDIIDKEHQTRLYDAVTDIKFDWHFLEDATYEKVHELDQSTPSFGHLLFHNGQAQSDYFKEFESLLDDILKKSNMTMTSLLRMRLGFLLNTKYIFPGMMYKYNTPHVDYNQEHFTAVYYLNDADGETVVFHELEQVEKFHPMHKCMPEQGKVLIFNGKHYHASTCPKLFTKRIALTINFTGSYNE